MSFSTQTRVNFIQYETCLFIDILIFCTLTISLTDEGRGTSVETYRNFYLFLTGVLVTLKDYVYLVRILKIVSECQPPPELIAALEQFGTV